MRGKVNRVGLFSKPRAQLSQVIRIDKGKIQAHLGEVVRNTVEETLKALLDAEADRLCRAERCQRTQTSTRRLPESKSVDG